MPLELGIVEKENNGVENGYAVREHVYDVKRVLEV